MRRRDFVAGLGIAAVWPMMARGQQQRIPVIGFLSYQIESRGAGLVAAVRRGLGEQGFVEGQNVEILYRWAGGFDQLPALAADLVRRRVDVIVTPGGGTGAALAAKAATTTIPIVFAVGSDPVQVGFVASLARPRGNMTGSTRLTQELSPKCLEILHSVVPGAVTIGILVEPRVPYAAASLEEAKRAAPGLGVHVVAAEARDAAEIDSAIASLSKQGIGALLVNASTLFSNHRERLIALTAGYALPTMFQFREFVDVGGLMSYGPNVAEGDRLTGVYAGRILKGEKPQNLPVQQSTKVELVINLKTAKSLRLTIPLAVLGRADEVIE
jgi:putative tryptophan/tyrosine transport system substrate-binding protein